jgi:IstB-like ATP binding protein
VLRTLKMHGIAQAVGELTEQGSPAFEAALPILSQRLKAETPDREVRSTACQLKAARFPNYRDLANFDFASSEVNEALARQLHRCEFLEDAPNVVLTAPAQARRIVLPRSASRPSSITSSASASSPPSNSSTLSNERSFRANPARSRPGSSTPTSSSSTDLVTCRSAPPAGPCSSICLASSASAPPMLDNSSAHRRRPDALPSCWVTSVVSLPHDRQNDACGRIRDRHVSPRGANLSCGRVVDQSAFTRRGQRRSPFSFPSTGTWTVQIGVDERFFLPDNLGYQSKRSCEALTRSEAVYEGEAGSG